MKPVAQPQQQDFNFSMVLFFCSFILIILCASRDVDCLTAVDDNDRLALIAFKNEITEDPLGILSSWNNKNNSIYFCNWRGVTCSVRHRSRVTMLDLNSQGLIGSISPNIGNLSFLKDLILSNNSLTGKIPRQIGRLFRLQRLDLSHNFLYGGIPNELSNLSNLKKMLLTHNNLSGEIPTSLGNLSSLTQLALRYNFNLEGRIPSTLGQLTGLQVLGLDSNRFSGIVPSSLYNISSLKIFSLMDNQLHGSIPFDVGFTLPNLNYFSVSANNFTGTIPNSFSNMSRLKMLQLQRNDLVGSVPYNLGDIESLTVLLLAGNNLGYGKANDLNFLSSLVNCTNLKLMIAGSNNFGGVLPSSIANLTTNLVTLALQNNKIYGSVPAGIQNLVGLTNLGLDDNMLTGSIPLGIGNLRNLGRLIVGKNKFSGSLPSSLSNLTRLIELSIYDNKLTGLIPSTIVYCKSLEVLQLQTNRLCGSIPKEVFQFPSLVLSLANNLFTGSLPVEVGNLKNLGVLDLSRNKLSGIIPSTIGECLSLTQLYLDGNFFQGNIPPAITSLKGLQFLKLSHNNLSGALPKGLENLSTLIQLDLSYNDLEGVVPKDGVFKNIGALSIEGNSKLCGGIPELMLPNCSIPLKKKQRKPLSIKSIIIITSTVVLFLALTTLSLTLYGRKKAKPTLHPMALDAGNQFMGISYNELLKATNGFNNSTNLLGVGSFGSVYKGILHEADSIPVAVKVIHLQQRGATKSFMSECDALRRVRHRNLLKIIPCCSSTDFQGNDFKALVFELMGNGSLENWLHPTIGDTVNNDVQLQVKNLNLKRRLNVAVDIASALNYLHHDCGFPLVHCDLKPSNVLLDDDLTAHVGDFGLAKFLSHTSSDSRPLNEHDASSIAIKGSIGYVPPEYGMGGEVSTLGDVYSYGILLLEMFTGKRPTDEMFKDGLNIHNFSKMHAFPERVLYIVDSRILLELEVEHHDDNESNNYNMAQSERRNRATHTTRQILASIIQIGVICSSELPSDRISMSKAIVDVQAVKNQYLGIRM